MSSYITGTFYALTNIGKVRQTNEDFADKRINSFSQYLLVVCDGMGGANKGDYASNYLGRLLCDEFLEIEKELSSPKQIKKWLLSVIDKANLHIYEKAHSSDEFKGMGTTLSVALINGNNLVTAQVGDSRIYKMKDDNLIQISVDQTYVQHLTNDSKIKKEEASSHPDRHKLTNAIGISKVANVDLNIFEYNGEALLLCSDGLYNNVPFNDMASIMKSNETVERKAKQLVAFGNANGGSDNMAVVVWETL